MAAVSKLASDVGTSAACQNHHAVFASARPSSSGTRNGPGAAAFPRLPVSLDLPRPSPKHPEGDSQATRFSVRCIADPCQSA